MNRKSSRVALTLALSILSPTYVALAEEEPEAPAAEESKPAEPSPGEVKRATESFEQGMKQFEAQEFEPALESFRRSYETVNSPNSHFMVARTLAKLGRNEEAYLELSRTIREADAAGERYADTAESARAKQEEIRPRIGLISVDAAALPKGSKLTLEGEVVPPEDYGDPIPVLPGHVTLVVELPDGRVTEHKVFVKTGGDKKVRLSKPKKAAPKEDTSTYITRDVHEKYWVELTLGGAWTIMEPPGVPNQGVGPSGRLAVQILPKGFIPGLNDGLAIGGGADFIATSEPSHFWFPVYAQWNLFVTPKLSVMFEPGVSIMTKDGGVNANVMVGARYALVGNWLGLSARVGIPMLQAGVTALF